MIDTLLRAWALVAIVSSTLLLSLGLALALLRQGRKGAPGAPRSHVTSVHIVRPLCGREEDAARKNASLLRQNHAPLTVAFVAGSEADAGLFAARELAADSCIVAHDSVSASGKARNMIAGWRASTADYIAFCDSDIELAPNAVTAALEAIEQGHAAAAFAPSLYDDSGIWGRLAMQIATIDKLTLAEAGATLGVVPYIEGGFMLISRAALEASGGIELVRDALADDLRIGCALRAHGHRLAVSRVPIVHRTARESARVWAERYLRWAICRRSEAPLLPRLTLLLHPVVVPLLVAALRFDACPWRWFAAGIVWRTGYSFAATRWLLAPHGIGGSRWSVLRPVAELLDAAFLVAAAFTRTVCWRGVSYRIDAGGRLSRRDARKPEPSTRRVTESS